MIIFPRFLLSIVISSIIYPVTMLHAGKSLPEIQRRRHQKAYGFQKLSRQTKDQKVAERRYETRENRTRLQDQYDSSLAIAKARPIDLTQSTKPKSQQSHYLTRAASKKENPDVAQKVTSNGKGLLRISLRSEDQPAPTPIIQSLPNGVNARILPLNTPQLHPAYRVQSSNGQIVNFLSSSSTAPNNVIKQQAQPAPLKINEVTLADGRKFKFLTSNQPRNNNVIDLTTK